MLSAALHCCPGRPAPAAPPPSASSTRCWSAAASGAAWTPSWPVRAPRGAVTHAPAQAALAAALAALLRRQDAALSALDCAVQERRAAECAEAGGGAPCGCLPPTLPEVLASALPL